MIVEPVTNIGSSQRYIRSQSTPDTKALIETVGEENKNQNEPTPKILTMYDQYGVAAMYYQRSSDVGIIG